MQGCFTRTYQHDRYDPNGITDTYYYRTESFASDVEAEGVKVKTKDGNVLEVFKPVQDNDSLKVVSTVGIAETK